MLLNKKQDLASQLRRTKILDATLLLFSENGLSQLRIAEISKRSGASIGSIYHHFKDREGVIYALYHDSFVDCFEQLRQSILEETDAESGIKRFVVSYLQWVFENPAQASFIYAASQEEILRRHQDELHAFKSQFYLDIFSWMSPFIQSGELLALPPWAYDAIIMGPAHEFSRRWLGGLRDLSMEEAQSIIADAVWRAIHID
ncbi:MAG: TetR/AcrR family transcriptional regulator [Chloroflexota bacterium]